MSSAFVAASPFRTTIPIRRLPIEPSVNEVRLRFEAMYGEDPEDRGGWLHKDDWYRLSFVLNALRRGGRFLDIGLGAGQFINAVASTGWFSEVHGSDPTRFKKYEEFHPGIQRVDASVADLPYPDDYFDVVTCMEVLEHVPDEIFEASIDELRRVCRGQLLMSVPYEEPEPIYASHRRRFEAEDIWRVFPQSERVLLSRPRMPWALMEEWCGPDEMDAPSSALRLGAVEAALAASPPPKKSAAAKAARSVVAPIEAVATAAPADGWPRRLLRKLRR